MNERIKELAEQAGAYFAGPMRKAAGGSDVEFVDIKQFYRFAELIVRECVNISEEHAKSLEAQSSDPYMALYEDGIVNGIYEATAAIKKHFGVEE